MSADDEPTASAPERVGPPGDSAALARARAAARRRGTPSTRAARTPSRRAAGAQYPLSDPTMSGPGPSERDPQLVGAIVDGIAETHGWQVDLAVGSLAGRWPELVGTDVAEHCRPERFDNGELVLVAESTAWATQLRLLAPTLVARIAAGVGPDIVRRVVVHGPSAPSWRRGAWRVAGRGPRDTYG